MSKTAILAPVLFFASAPFAQSQDFGPPQHVSKPVVGALSGTPADLDGDGDMDLLVGSANDGRLSWFENLGAGTFAPLELIAQTLGTVNSIEAADLDGDGDLDAVVFSQQTLEFSFSDKFQITWHENLGGGNFGPVRVIFNNPSWDLSSATVTDYDGDGDLDILSTMGSDTGDVIGLLENDGNGNFPLWQQHLYSSPLDTHTFPGNLIVEDQDQDGDQDILVAFRGTSELVWFANDGTGTLGPEQLLKDNFYNSGVLLSTDMDGDGDRDIVGASSFFYRVSWLERLGSGVLFGPETVIALEGEDPGTRALTASDLDGDGDHDVLAFSGDELQWHENLGFGLFSNGKSISQEIEFGTSAFAVDFDGDGDLDVASTSSKDNKVAWYEGLGGGTFGPQIELTVRADDVRDVFVADLDGDGGADILSASREDNKVAWYKSLGNGAFGPQVVVSTSPQAPTSIRAADLDGDGELDVLVASEADSTVSWFANLGGGLFGPRQIISNAVTNAICVRAGDLDGDGDLEIVAAAGGGKNITWYENLGGAFGPKNKAVSDTPGVFELALEDLDSDGDLDLIYVASVSGPSSNELAWLENLGSGVFAPKQVLDGALFSVRSVYTCDLDGDGDADVLAGSLEGDQVTWYENLGGGSFSSRVVITGFGSSNRVESVFATDFDGDGDKDVISGSEYSLDWYENLGAGGWGPKTVISYLPRNVAAILAEDLDGDGDADVLAISPDYDLVTWFENLMLTDCNGNGIQDGLDIQTGLSADCNSNGIPDECELLVFGADIDGDGQLDDCVTPPLRADSYELSLAAGGVQNFELFAPTPGDTYILLGSVSGTTPGFDISGINLPLNADNYFTRTATLWNTPPLQNSLGVLQANGTASASFTLPAGFAPGLVGLTLHHAYAVLDFSISGIKFASNAVPLTLSL